MIGNACLPAGRAPPRLGARLDGGAASWQRLESARREGCAKTKIALSRDQDGILGVTAGTYGGRDGVMATSDRFIDRSQRTGWRGVRGWRPQEGGLLARGRRRLSGAERPSTARASARERAALTSALPRTRPGQPGAGSEEGKGLRVEGWQAITPG